VFKNYWFINILKIKNLQKPLKMEIHDLKEYLSDDKYVTEVKMAAMLKYFLENNFLKDIKLAENETKFLINKTIGDYLYFHFEKQMVEFFNDFLITNYTFNGENNSFFDIIMPTHVKNDTTKEIKNILAVEWNNLKNKNVKKKH
jgi:hypothetical protein